MESFSSHWQDFLNLVTSDKGFSFLIGFLVGYIFRAIKV